MDGISLILLGVLMFTLIVILLVIVILIAKSKLVASGHAKININDDPERQLEIPTGDKLLNALSNVQIFLPSACGVVPFRAPRVQCRWGLERSAGRDDNPCHTTAVEKLVGVSTVPRVRGGGDRRCTRAESAKSSPPGAASGQARRRAHW